MYELRLPWLELAILVPLLAAILVRVRRDPRSTHRWSVTGSAFSLACTISAWQDFLTKHPTGAHDRWDLLSAVFHRDLLVIDELSAPLLPLVALIFLLTILATPLAKARTFSFSRCLIDQSIVIATFCCELPWGVIVLMAAGTVPPYLELRKMRKPTRVYLAHMSLFVTLLVLGQALLDVGGGPGPVSLVATALLTLAVLLRSGIVPVHCWMTDLFEHASFGTALLTVAPMVGAYGVTRLVLPVAPHWALGAISVVSLFTALYAAGMALVQQEARRFFCYLFLSHSSLVLVGLETATPISLTGALSVWVSVGLALTGFGLTMRCIESRTGRTSLAEFHGLYRHVPMLAALFLLTGLASIGFPGTGGFVGLELLIEGASQAQPLEGAAVVIVAALNGLAVMFAYFRIFTGKPHVTSIDLRTRPAERISALVLTVLIIGYGLYPQSGVTSRYLAAVELAGVRVESGLDEAPSGHGAAEPVVKKPSPPPIPSSTPTTSTTRTESVAAVRSLATGPAVVPQEWRP
jgi:NADH-quinone oxidoreductase subunit M